MTKIAHICLIYSKLPLLLTSLSHSLASSFDIFLVLSSFVFIICVSVVDLFTAGMITDEQDLEAALNPESRGWRRRCDVSVVVVGSRWAGRLKRDTPEHTLHEQGRKEEKEICDVVRWRRRRDRWCGAAGGDTFVSWMITAKPPPTPTPCLWPHSKTSLTDQSITYWKTPWPVCDFCLVVTLRECKFLYSSQSNKCEQKMRGNIISTWHGKVTFCLLVLS